MRTKQWCARMLSWQEGTLTGILWAFNGQGAVQRGLASGSRSLSCSKRKQGVRHKSRSRGSCWDAGATKQDVSVKHWAGLAQTWAGQAGRPVSIWSEAVLAWQHPHTRPPGPRLLP